LNWSIWSSIVLTCRGFVTSFTNFLTSSDSFFEEYLIKGTRKNHF
jgi:hypothetical protein